MTLETELEILTRPDDLRTAAFKYRRNNPYSVSHETAAFYLEKCAERIEHLVKQHDDMLAALEYAATRIDDPVDTRLIGEAIASVKVSYKVVGYPYVKGI